MDGVIAVKIERLGKSSWNRIDGIRISNILIEYFKYSQWKIGRYYIDFWKFSIAYQPNKWTMPF